MQYIVDKWLENFSNSIIIKNAFNLLNFYAQSLIYDSCVNYEFCNFYDQLKLLRKIPDPQVCQRVFNNFITESNLEKFLIINFYFESKKIDGSSSLWCRKK